jgi:hypothetical protein
MKDVTSNMEIQLRLIKVQETGFFMDTAKLSSITNKNPELFNIEIGLQVLPDLSKDLLDLELIVRYLLREDSVNNKVVELQTSNLFEIHNLSNVLSITDTELTDKNNVIPTLVGIALGTLRGILVVKGAGTILNEYPIPIVNPTDLCKGIHKEQ